jgi:Arc/MetJ-type ribon-helix-helix transcriptional regulator
MDMEFDYRSPAELFIPKHADGKRRQRINYRRFTTAAEAIRFAVEEFPAVRTLGAWMQVGDQRYDSNEICRLYESSGYPLRKASA